MSESRLVIGVLASGRGSNLQAILNAIPTGLLTARVGVVISDKKEAHALRLAKNHSVLSFYVDPAPSPHREGYDAAVADLLRAHAVELVVLAGYMRLVTQPMLEAFPNRIINIHPSLLPSFPGLHAPRQALAHGVKVSGCTVHFVDEEADHGPIIAQAAVPVLEGDTEASLADRILVEEHRLLPRVIQYYAEGNLTISGGKVVVKGSL